MNDSSVANLGVDTETTEWKTENYHQDDKRVYRRIDFLKQINDFLEEGREEHPDIKIVGVNSCYIDYEVRKNIGTKYVEASLSVQVQYDKDGPVFNTGSSMSVKLDYINEIVDSASEFFNGERKKRKRKRLRRIYIENRL